MCFSLENPHGRTRVLSLVRFCLSIPPRYEDSNPANSACIRARNIPGSSATWGPWRRLRRQSIAIEIKLWQADGTGQNPWSDVKRLQSHSLERKSSGHLFTGITILFVHRGARNEQKLNNITGNKPERSRFPERRCYIPFGYFNGMEQGFDLILERCIGANLNL